MARFGRSRPKAVMPLDELAATSSRRDTQAGALARALVSAERLGVVVPESWVVVAEVFRHVVHESLPPGHDMSSLLRTVQRPIGVERAARARERLLRVVLDSELEREIDLAWQKLSEAAPWGVAVRASAVLADQGLSRAAGLSCTELPIQSRDDLGRAIRRVWARAASEATLDYLRGRRIRDLALAVVLQPVVVARTSLTLITDARGLLEPESISAAAVPLPAAIAISGLATEAVDLAEAEVVNFSPDGRMESCRPSSQKGMLVVSGSSPAEAVAPDSGSLLG